MNRWDKQHLINLGLTQKQIDNIFDMATREAAAIGASLHEFDPDKPFTFADYPRTKELIDDAIKKLVEQIEATVVNGVRSEWAWANNKNDAFADRVFGENKSRLTKEQARKYYDHNDKAREAFIKRKEGGLNLSERVWNYASQFKSEIEMGLDLGIRDGLSAVEIARELKQYLREPARLFRRVRDKHGQLHLSKNAEAYHPGRGVNRSSYKNALRLAATEINTAYRTSDHERWLQSDFVVGIEVFLSNNHTLNGVPFYDICDELKGKYPKTFKFTGWHPSCRCHAISIHKTEEEIWADTERLMNGEEPAEGSVNEVKDLPAGFKQWVDKNAERIERAEQRGTLPYFLKDNGAFDEATGKWALKITANSVAYTYSPERKMNALNFENEKTADDYMRSKCSEIWRDLGPKTKDALHAYTGTDYYEINETLYRNFAESEKAKLITEAISKSVYDKDIYLNRDISYDELKGVFGIDSDKIKQLDNDGNFYKTDSQLKEIEEMLNGKHGIQEGFMSCGTSKKNHFGGNLTLKVYAPKGTEMMYAEPFSEWGGEKFYGKWDGVKKQDKFGIELETIINRGYEMRITGVRKVSIHSSPKLEVEVEILTRNNRRVK